MNAAIDEQLLDAVNAISPARCSGQFFRYTSARRDPLSGEGARLNGGRWNPAGLFPVIYLGSPAAACMRELEKFAADNRLEVAEQLQVPFKLHTIRVDDIPVLDLRDEATLIALGLETDDLSGSWEGCQPIGHAAWFLEFAGVLAPSATGAGETLALFEHKAGAGKVVHHESRPITHELYLEIIAGEP